MSRCWPRPLRTIVLGAVLVALALIVGSLPAATIARVGLGDGMAVSLTDSGDLFLEATPQRGEGLWAFSRRLTGDTTAVREIADANGGIRRLRSDIRYKVPYDVILADLQVKVIGKLFPESEPRPDGYHLVVRRGLAGIDLWHVSEWLTGSGDHFTTLRETSGLPADNDLTPGTGVTVPRALLRPAFRALLPPPAPTVVAAGAGDGPLSYTYDGGDRFAVYRLKRGEALYSAVVSRFTGLVFAKDVNRVASEIARLNNIRDVTDMAVGQPVRIPLDLLLPEYLPPDDPRRQEWANDQAESAKYSNTVRASCLEGITVILDAGHGGEDPGVDHKGTWESTYVYDVMLRAKRLLEERTAATVVPTTRDGSAFQLTQADLLPRSRSHRVLTTPEYVIRNTTVSNHLRWYLANHHYRRALARDPDPSKVVFISLHADSLHASLRGAMTYVPATGLRRGSFGKKGSVYQARAEFREKPTVAYSWKERTRSEGLSRELSEKILASFRRHGLRVHKQKPIRDRIIRCRRCRPFVPAVVRYNAVPTKLLLEICNMNNPQDRELLRTQAFRERVATALVDAILDYYGQPALPERQRIAATR
ncbi:MAG: N-acetylmuramoyl-L-alanine amidase [Acidobacteriota bacterium]